MYILSGDKMFAFPEYIYLFMKFLSLIITARKATILSLQVYAIYRAVCRYRLFAYYRAAYPSI